MTIHVPEVRRRLPLVSSRATRLRILAEAAVNAYLDDTADRSERDECAAELIEFIKVNRPILPDRDYVGRFVRFDTITSLTKGTIKMYLEDGATQRERIKRADALMAVVRVYMRREAR